VARLKELAERPIVVSPRSLMVDVFAALRVARRDHAVVVEDGAVVGVITRAQLADALADEVASLAE
jgi:CBS domain-containing protein